MFKELNDYYADLHNSPEPDRTGGFMDGRICVLCGTEWEKSLMAVDEDCSECYCKLCIESGEVTRYLQRCDYTIEMIKKVLTNIKHK